MSRVEEFLVQQTAWSPQTKSAQRVTPEQVAEACRKAGATVALQYFIGTAQHESNFAINERDTEENGFQSYGIFQLSQYEARTVKMPGANLLDLDVACRVMVLITENRRKFLRSILRAAPNEPDVADLCAYIAVMHNVGENDPTFQNIPKYGMNWKKWKDRNYLESSDGLAKAKAAALATPNDEAVRAQLAKSQRYYNWTRSMAKYGDDCLPVV